MKKDIWCTLGPSSLNQRVIKRLEDLGVTVFRINLSHTRITDLKSIIERISNITDVPICLDTEGPQIRTGSIKNDNMKLVTDSSIKILKNPIIGEKGDFSLYPQSVFKQLKVEDTLQVDHDSALIKIIEINSKYAQCRVLNGGIIGQNKAVDLNRIIIMESLTPKDYKAINIGLNCGIDHFALSFCESIDVIRNVRSIVGKDKYITAKIESIDGLNNLGKIIDESDAILIDRGDLSRQVSIEKIPIYQKQIINAANSKGRLVYVATNLLESMTNNLFPTRAEVSDVYNTLGDGADGLVLAGETAVGKHPVQSTIIISNIIKQYDNKKYKQSVLISNDVEKNYSSTLVEPHGGTLVNRVLDNPDLDHLSFNKNLCVSMETLLDIEQIAIGSFSPLKGFMNKDEIESVLNYYKLPDGLIWPLPVFLQTQEEFVVDLQIGDKVNIVYETDSIPYAIVEIEDIYQYDLDQLVKGMFSTIDLRHPGVARVKKGGSFFISGEVSLLRSLPSKHKYYSLTPSDTRKIFYCRGWSRVVGFHTRNVPHRAHEYMQSKALEDYFCDGLLIHPIIGPKKVGDFSSDILLKSYQILMNNNFLNGRTLLAGFNSYPRYCGPREAVFTALCRKNFGCSHFIIGRDHTGVGNHYSKDSMDNLFEELGDLGIKPIFFDNVKYDKKLDSYFTLNSSGSRKNDYKSMSGTEAREMLRKGKSLPGWYMRKEISKAVIDEIRNNSKVFLE